MSIRIGIAMLLITLGIFVIAVAIFGLFKYRDALQALHAGALIDTVIAFVFAVYALFQKETLARQGRKLLYAFQYVSHVPK